MNVPFLTESELGELWDNTKIEVQWAGGNKGIYKLRRDVNPWRIYLYAYSVVDERAQRKPHLVLEDLGEDKFHTRVRIAK